MDILNLIWTVTPSVAGQSYQRFDSMKYDISCWTMAIRWVDMEVGVADRLWWFFSALAQMGLRLLVYIHDKGKDGLFNPLDINCQVSDSDGLRLRPQSILIWRWDPTWLLLMSSAQIRGVHWIQLESDKGDSNQSHHVLCGDHTL